MAGVNSQENQEFAEDEPVQEDEDGQDTDSPEDFPESQSPAPESESEEKTDDAPVAPDKVILVVEDDLDTADSLKVKLESNGFDVLAVFDGLQALETARKIRPALVILDVMVPGLMGYHVCRLLKFDERYRKIPIIMLTGKVDRESREIGTRAGADMFMTKPFEMDDLVKEVKKLVVQD